MADDYRSKHAHALLQQEGKQIQENLKKDKERLEVSRELAKELKSQMEDTDKVDDILNNILGTENLRKAVLDNMKALKEAVTKEDKAKALADQKALQAASQMNDATRDQLSGITSLIKGARTFVAVLLTNPFVALAAAAIALVKALYSAYTAARDMRTELGGS